MEKDLYKSMLESSFLERPGDSYKNKFGKCLVIGGSYRYPNAPILSSIGALAASPGYVGLKVNEKIENIVRIKAPLPVIFCQDHKEANSFDAVLFGNGIEYNQRTTDILSYLLKNLETDKTLIIDATGIECFRRLMYEAKNAKCQVIITPHIGEARNLVGRAHTEEGSLGDALRDLASTTDTLILLKSYKGRIIDAEGLHEYDYEPTPILSKAGSGDVLAGFLAGLFCYLPKMGYKNTDILEFGDTLFHKAFKCLQDKKGPALAGPGDIKEALELYLLRP